MMAIVIVMLVLSLTFGLYATASSAMRAAVGVGGVGMVDGASVGDTVTVIVFGGFVDSG